MPAFPFKSANHEHKTYNEYPDKGELVALELINHFISGIRQIYEPGAMIYVVSDGRVFTDVFGITDEDTNKYWDELKNMGEKL